MGVNSDAALFSCLQKVMIAELMLMLDLHEILFKFFRMFCIGLKTCLLLGGELMMIIL
jgi:hypothetical protein